MTTFLKRRDFLSRLPLVLGGGLIPLVIVRDMASGQVRESRSNDGGCWLDVCAPFVIEDRELGIHSEIILTSDTFSGKAGHADGADETEYEIYLYSADGQPVGERGVAKRIVVPAMHNTVLAVRELVSNKDFFGGLTVRLRPATRTPMHASDLFSSAFVRWISDNSFDNVHANPDPPIWQTPKAFFYSMPFPPLGDYDCLFSMFNPYSVPSRGNLTLYDPLGKSLRKLKYEMSPHTSLILSLREGQFVSADRALHTREKPRRVEMLTAGGGTIAITNESDSVKNFGFMMMKRPEKNKFSMDHPIHQSPFDPAPAKMPVDKDGQFKAKNILYTPLVFNSRRIGGISLDSRFHLSSGAPMEVALWAAPFIVDKDGGVSWQLMNDRKLLGTFPSKQIERNVLKLGGQQSCILDSKEMGLPNDFSGGLSLAIAPLSNHTLMKVELLVEEWGAHAFTHFRPGLAAARTYQRPPQRDGIATDYITSGACLALSHGSIVRDEIVCVINIEDKATSGRPTLELFTSAGKLTQVELGEIPAFACRHYLLSELVSAKFASKELTLRLIDEEATLLMSIVHLDYVRRDLALDHGSDRFSTFQEFKCGWAA